MWGSFAGLLLAAFALGTLVAPSHALKFNFTDVQQCDPFIINFAGNNLTSTSGTPTSLSILPINGSVIAVPLPNPFVISTGISLNFLPLPAGSNFLASLDDEKGDNVIFTSDLMRVLPSQSNNSSCLTSSNTQVQQHFKVDSNPSQCQNFSISYNTSLISQAPTVRLYVPNGPSFALNNTADDPGMGRATYFMRGFRGVEIVLLIDDGREIREATPLITIGGDSASDISCLGTFNSSSASYNGNKVSGNSPPVLGSKAVIIGGASGGAALLVVVGFMAVFIVRERRRRRHVNMTSIAFDREKMTMSTMDEERDGNGIPHLMLPQQSQSPHSISRNPVYTMVSNTPRYRDDRSSIYSAQVGREKECYPVPGPSPRKAGGQLSPRGSDNMSIQSLDIEGMLNMATLQMEASHSGKNPSINFPTPLPGSPSSSLAVPAPTIRSQGSRRHMRDPSDVPRSPASINPFDDGAGSRQPSGIHDTGGPINNYVHSPLKEVATAKPAPSVLSRSDTLASGKSTNYWYGVAR